jgi:hypothetical protein
VNESTRINFSGQGGEAIVELSKTLDFEYNEFGNNSGIASLTSSQLPMVVGHIWASAFEIAAYNHNFKELRNQLKSFNYLSPWAPALIQRNKIDGPFFRRSYDDTWGNAWKHFFALAFEFSTVENIGIPTPHNDSRTLENRKSSLLEYFFNELVIAPITAQRFSEEDPSWHTKYVELMVQAYLDCPVEEEGSNPQKRISSIVRKYQRIIAMHKTEEIYHQEVSAYLGQFLLNEHK